MLLSDKKKEFREMSDQIYEVGFAGRIRIDAHSLTMKVQLEMLPNRDNRLSEWGKNRRHKW
jgi:hypothetical protein